MDKRKILLLAAILILSIKSVSENSVEIDLNNDTLKSTEGLEINYGDTKLTVLEAEHDRDTDILYLTKPFTARVYNPAGRLYFYSEKGDVERRTGDGNFYNSFGHLEVGHVTGAEYPNDKIYFGGQESQYRLGKVHVSDGWFTTDPEIKKDRNPDSAGYTLRSRDILVEPNKQVTLKGINLYHRKNRVLPIGFPWFRLNIRPESKVPLFPTWGDATDYGWYTSWGMLYGDKNAGYMGGFAPKFADRMGLLVGRWENWYKFEKLGETKLNVDDWLILKKDSNEDSRYKVNLLHSYSGEYGHADFDLLHSTFNMIDPFNDLIKKYDYVNPATGKNSWETLGIDQLKNGDVAGFYSVDTTIKGLGEQKDTDFTLKLKQVSDRNAYDVMVFDYIEDGSNEDYDLFTKLSVNKDNDKYHMSTYYNELRDMNPGNSTSDDRSFEEGYGFKLEDKENRAVVTYDRSDRDKFRTVRYIEKYSQLKPAYFNIGDTLVGKYGNYTLNMIPEYSIYDSDILNVELGKYRLNDKIDYRVGFKYKNIENELSLSQDPLRAKIQGNQRDTEWNRYRNNIYEKTDENRVSAEFTDNIYSLNIGAGSLNQEIWDREGIYNFTDFVPGKAYNKYATRGTFVDLTGEKNYTDSGILKDVNLLAGIKVDNFNSFKLNDVDLSGKDRNAFQLKFGKGIRKIISQEDNELKNEVNFFVQSYTDRDVKLHNMENFYKIGDTLSFDWNKVSGNYDISYKESERASTGNKIGSIFSTGIDLNVNEIHEITSSFKSDSRFTNSNLENRNMKDLTFQDFVASYRYGSHKFSYTDEKIKSDIWKIKDTDDSYEKIDTKSYTYSYDLENRDRFTLSYMEGSDFRNNLTRNIQEIGIKKNNYSANFFDYGDRYDNSYSVGYGKKHYGELASAYDTYTYSFGYVFTDKDISSEYIEEYAMREFDKDRDELTTEDRNKAFTLIKQRAMTTQPSLDTKFNLISPWRRPAAFTGNYRRSFSFNTHMEKNEDRYKLTGDFYDSLEYLSATVGYSEKRIGLSYTYKEEVTNVAKWSDSQTKEHLLALNMKIGKPSKSYRLTTYAKFENDWFQNKDRTDGSIGIELGKEFGYYEWSLGFVREHRFKERDTDWKAALQFTLLTFPKLPIFGAGAKYSGYDAKVNPKFFLFDGVKASDVDFDD